MLNQCGWQLQRFNQGTALKRTIFELIAQELIDTYAAANAATPDSTAHGNGASAAARYPVATILSATTLLPNRTMHAAHQETISEDVFNHRANQEKGAPRPSPAKRQLSWEPGTEDGEGLAFSGPGGGAIEGPPLLGRASAGSAHGGLEYYRCGTPRALHSSSVIWQTVPLR